MDIFTRTTLKDKVILEPKDINTAYKERLLECIERKLCGKCSSHGFIKANSIKIIDIGYGVLQEASLNGNVLYKIEFSAEVCNPLVGCVMKATVMKSNRFGILAESGYTDENNKYVPIIQAIIPKNSVQVQSEYELENIKVNEDIMVEIVAKKFELGDNRIRVIARAVLTKPKGTTRNIVNSIQTVDEDDAIDGGEYSAEGGSVDEEEEDSEGSEGEVEKDISEQSSEFSNDDDNDFFSETEGSFEMYGDDDDGSVKSSSEEEEDT